MLFGNNVWSNPQFALLCGPNLEGKARLKIMNQARYRWNNHLKQTVAGQVVVVVDDERKRMWSLSRFF